MTPERVNRGSKGLCSHTARNSKRVRHSFEGCEWIALACSGMEYGKQSPIWKNTEGGAVSWPDHRMGAGAGLNADGPLTPAALERAKGCPVDQWKGHFSRSAIRSHVWPMTSGPWNIYALKIGSQGANTWGWKLKAFNMERKKEGREGGMVNLK